MYFRGKKVLVTGGAGFIGSNLVDRLVEENAEVMVLDDLFTGRVENIKYFRNISFIHGSVTNESLVYHLVKQADIVFNLAVRNIIVSPKQPGEDFAVNAMGTFHILNAALKSHVERVVYTSSASVYGNARHLPVCEDDMPSILTPYAASKMSGENYCSAYYEMYNLPVTVLRYSNAFGINQSPSNPYCGVVSKFFNALMNNQPLRIFGDGVQTRDFTFVGDIVDATLLAAQSPKAIGEVFNVATGIETSIQQLASLIMRVVREFPEPEHTEKRDIDTIRRRVLNVEKIRQKLHWSPATSLFEGLKKTYDWLCEIRDITQENVVFKDTVNKRIQ
ncbi:MAG: NAD-dependent epimerase/dehydratase family protein [Candidatus Zhuqueibacterota bacterium]